MIKVIVERRLRSGRVEDIARLLAELSRRERQQNGYLSGEILQSADDPSLWVDISTWTYSEQWKRWETTPGHNEIQLKMNDLLIAPEKVSIFTIMR